jgi:hypothetical protein
VPKVCAECGSSMYAESDLDDLRLTLYTCFAAGHTVEVETERGLPGQPPRPAPCPALRIPAREEAKVSKWVLFEPRSRGNTARLSKSGELALAGQLYEKLGKPEKVELLFNPETWAIGVRAPRTNHALRVTLQSTGQARVSARRFCEQFGIRHDAVLKLTPGYDEAERMLVLPLPPESRPNNGVARARPEQEAFGGPRQAVKLGGSA